ncbi:hypothetical protein ACFLUV_03105 [Elusimicrobiota bacterium]
MNTDNNNWRYHLAFLALLLVFFIGKSNPYALVIGFITVGIAGLFIYDPRMTPKFVPPVSKLFLKHSDTIQKIIRICTYILFITAVSLVLYRAVSILFYPFQFEFSEGFLLNEANLLAKGRSLYNSIDQPPYYIGNYTFIYQLIYGLILKIAGSPNFFAGRLITILSTFGICFLIFRIVMKDDSKKLFVPIFSTVAFFTTWYVYENMPYVTVGVLSLFWGLLGLYWVDRYKDSKTVYWAALFFCLALYTKQSWIATTLSGLIYLYLHDKKTFFRFIIYLAAGGAAVLLITTIITRGEFFKHIFIYTVQTPFSAGRAFSWLARFVHRYFVLAFFGIYYLVFSFIRKERSPYIIYFIISIPVAFAVGRKGAYANYFWDLAIASSIIAGFCLKMIFSDGGMKKSVNFLVCLIILLQSMSLLHLKADKQNMLDFKFKLAYSSSSMPDKEKIPVYEELYKLFKNTEGRIITNREYGLVAMAGKQVEYHFFLDYLENWKKENLLNDIKEGRYELAVFRRRVGKLPFKEYSKAIKDNFKLESRIDRYYIYRFKGKSK